MTQRFGARLGLAVLVGVLALQLAGCGKTIKAEGAEKSITDLVSEQTGFKPTDVKCPSGVDAEVGKKFECQFTGPEGKPYTAQVEITKVEGEDVEYYIETRPS